MKAKAQPSIGPCYWMDETTGELKAAVEAYMFEDPLTERHIAALRAYLRQWIEADVWAGPVVEGLRNAVSALSSRETIEDWLKVAAAVHIDPL